MEDAESWTGSIQRCPNSGIGCVHNAKYTHDGMSKPDHEYLHEPLNLVENQIRLYGLFCGYNGSKRVAKYTSNTFAYEIFREAPITEEMTKDEVTAALKCKFSTAKSGYTNLVNDILCFRLLQEDQSRESNENEIANLNSQLRAGATVLFVVAVGGTLFTVNCGNSRALMLYENENGELSWEQLNKVLHDNDDDEERQRLYELGIDPEVVGRPTRAFGDCFRGQLYHENAELSCASGQPVICDADVYFARIHENCVYLLMISDSVATTIEELGIQPEEVNNRLVQYTLREVNHGTVSCTSIAQAILDGIIREHKERFLSDTCKNHNNGTYNRHDDMSLLFAEFRKDASRQHKISSTLEFQESLPMEDPPIKDEEVVVTPVVDLTGIEEHPEILDELKNALGIDLTVSFQPAAESENPSSSTDAANSHMETDE